jgi:hypothetical protein
MKIGNNWKMNKDHFNCRCIQAKEFVCQNCGKIATVLYGNKIKCFCGEISSAELMRPKALPLEHPSQTKLETEPE